MLPCPGPSPPQPLFPAKLAFSSLVQLCFSQAGAGAFAPPPPLIKLLRITLSPSQLWQFCISTTTKSCKQLFPHERLTLKSEQEGIAGEGIGGAAHLGGPTQSKVQAWVSPGEVPRPHQCAFLPLVLSGNRSSISTTRLSVTWWRRSSGHHLSILVSHLLLWGWGTHPSLTLPAGLSRRGQSLGA